MHLLDQHRLDLLWRDLVGNAGHLRDLQSRLHSAALALSWHSPAAHCFEAALAGLLAEFRRLARRLEDLAGNLDAHRAGAAHQAAVLSHAVAQPASAVRAARLLAGPW